MSGAAAGFWLAKVKRDRSEDALVGESEWNSAAMGGTKRVGLATEASSVSKGK